MLVSQWMSRDLVTVPASLPISDAAREMARRRIRRLLVVQSPPPKAVLLGILSLGDVARAFPPEINPPSIDAASRGPEGPVADIMRRTVTTVEPDTPIEEAARLMVEFKIGALPVMRVGHLVGIITESDLFRALAEVVGGGVPGVRVTFDLADDEDAVDVVLDLAADTGCG